MRTIICWMLSKLQLPAALGLLGAFLLFKRFGDVGDDSIVKILMICLPIDVFLSVWAAVFTYKNFDEVFSRSSRWRSSNVEKFDVRLKYGIYVLFQSFFAFPAIFGIIGLIIYFVVTLI